MKLMYLGVEFYRPFIIPRLKCCIAFFFKNSGFSFCFPLSLSAFFCIFFNRLQKSVYSGEKILFVQFRYAICDMRGTDLNRIDSVVQPWSVWAAGAGWIGSWNACLLITVLLKPVLSTGGYFFLVLLRSWSASEIALSLWVSSVEFKFWMISAEIEPQILLLSAYVRLQSSLLSYTLFQNVAYYLLILSMFPKKSSRSPVLVGSMTTKRRYFPQLRLCQQDKKRYILPVQGEEISRRIHSKYLVTKQLHGFESVRELSSSARKRFSFLWSSYDKIFSDSFILKIF